MKNLNVILGVDVSKLTLDISCAERRLHVRVENQTKGFVLLKKWCRENNIDLQDTLVVMEHTGGYEYRFIQFCQASSITFCRVPGYEIKHSMGTTRGKDDMIDSYRIALFGEEKIKRLKPSAPVDQNILQLRHLLAFRKRLVRERAGLRSSAKERKHMYECSKKDRILAITLKKIKENSAHILELEMEITRIITGNEALLRSYKILMSIKGIGSINAWMTVTYTENFTLFPDARRYAVYIGVVPFASTSGTSIRGKSRVSHIAHKELKQELNQAAKAAIAHNTEIRAYATRKLESKCYPIVLNNVKFKLLLIMFSLIKRGETYVENYRCAA